jgi:hypothetical protein
MFKTATFRMSFALFAWRLIFVSALVLVFTSAAQAQTQASCVFALFPTTMNIPNIGTVSLEPAGINDFGTVVGQASNPNLGLGPVGFIRWSNGGISFPLGIPTVQNGTAYLNDRNDNGTSIGFLAGLGNILLNGTTATPIVLQIGNLNASNLGFSVNGINNWGTIVGYYQTSAPHGFKRWSNGGAFTLDYPVEGPATVASGINDHGTIVGNYFSTADPLEKEHGFIYQSGEWATLDFPNAVDTALVGISNAGIIVGNASFFGASSEAFLYKNGAFKVISVPNAPTNSIHVIGISPKLGLILGNANGSGFIAKCQ